MVFRKGGHVKRTEEEDAVVDAKLAIGRLEGLGEWAAYKKSLMGLFTHYYRKMMGSDDQVAFRKYRERVAAISDIIFLPDEIETQAKYVIDSELQERRRLRAEYEQHEEMNRERQSRESQML
jgi:hypothetical protein